MAAPGARGAVWSLAGQELARTAAVSLAVEEWRFMTYSRIAGSPAAAAEASLCHCAPLERPDQYTCWQAWRMRGTFKRAWSAVRAKSTASAMDQKDRGRNGKRLGGR